MAERTLDSALKQYRLVVDKLAELEAKHKAETVALQATKTKIRQWMSENIKDEETPAWLFELDPVLNWNICKRTDDVAVSSHMKIDDGILVDIKRQYEDSKKELEDCLESIENWGLQQMIARGSKGFKSDNGSAQLRNDTKYKVEDKVLLCKWALDNDAASELSISMRPNSKFAARVVDETGEMMPGVSSFKEQKCVYVKG